MREQERMIGDSISLTQALEQVSRLAPIQRPVLIIGERGTGKELAAERLHYLSPRWDGPLLKVNCAAIADSLLESELFGHEPGVNRQGMLILLNQTSQGLSGEYRAQGVEVVPRIQQLQVFRQYPAVALRLLLYGKPGRWHSRTFLNSVGDRVKQESNQLGVAFVLAGYRD